jgi:drug/metabolite transporter (DMT)-like permease
VLLIIQGAVGGSTLVLLFFTFRRLPLGDATTIIFSSPVFVMIMSFLFLREPCGFFRTLIVCLLLTGVVLISKPPFVFQVRLSQTN